MTGDATGATRVRTAVVTGGGRGLGRSIAETLADRGFVVFLTHRSPPATLTPRCGRFDSAQARPRACRWTSPTPRHSPRSGTTSGGDFAIEERRRSTCSSTTRASDCSAPSTS